MQNKELVHGKPLGIQQPAVEVELGGTEGAMDCIAGLDIHQGAYAVHEAVTVNGARVAALRVVGGVLNFPPLHRVFPAEFQIGL